MMCRSRGAVSPDIRGAGQSGSIHTKIAGDAGRNLEQTRE
jgi:hypothetical protein